MSDKENERATGAVIPVYQRCPAGCQRCGAPCRKVMAHPGNCNFHGRGKGGCPNLPAAAKSVEMEAPQCEVCGALFDTPSALGGHKRAHKAIAGRVN